MLARKPLDKIMTVVLVIAFWPALAGAQSVASHVASHDEVSNAITVQNTMAIDGVISGEIVNRSRHRMRDVTVLVQYHWLWNDEFNPGDNPPGKAIYVMLDREIPPKETVSFTYNPENPLRFNKDGYFMNEVSIAGFTVVVMP